MLLRQTIGVDIVQRWTPKNSGTFNTYPNGSDFVGKKMGWERAHAALQFLNLQSCPQEEILCQRV